jgi:hypothetical protein
MAAFNKVNSFVRDILKGVFNCASGADVLKDALSNTAPSASNALLSDITQITAANGYSSGGTTIGSTNVTLSGGTATLSGSNVVFTASGGTIGPFRYVVAYDSTPTSPLKPLIGWWDYGSSITLADGETFTVDHSANILTVA